MILVVRCGWWRRYVWRREDHYALRAAAATTQRRREHIINVGGAAFTARAVAHTPSSRPSMISLSKTGTTRSPAILLDLEFFSRCINTGGGGLGVGCAERERDRTAALPTRTWGNFSIEMDGTALRRRFSEWLRGSVLFLLRWPMWEPRVVIEFVSPRSLVSYPSILVRTLGEDPTKANIKRQLRIPWYHSRASPARPVTHVVCGKHGGIPWRVRLIAWFLITSSLYRSKRSHRSIFAVWSGESWQILPLQRSATTGFSSYATKNYL